MSKATSNPISKQQRLTHIEKALALMAHRLSDQAPVTVVELATAAVSPFHFHRRWWLLLGETCQQTYQWLKLARAATALSTTASVTGAAFTAGYHSGQALAKV